MNDKTQQMNRISQNVGLFLVSAAFLIMGGMAHAATYKGAAVRIGKGSARILVHTDKAGKPSSVAVKMSPGALQELPAEPKSTSFFSFVLRGGYRKVAMYAAMS